MEQTTNQNELIEKYQLTIDVTCEQLATASMHLRKICKRIVESDGSASGLFDAELLTLAAAALQAVEAASADLWECSTGIRETN